MARLTVIEGGKSAAQRFEAVLKPHYTSLYRTAWRWTRSPHDAEDLVQELCVRAFPRIQEIEQLENPRGWLMCVLYRLYVDLARRYERNYVSSMEAAELEVASDDPGPMEESESALQRERLDRAWQRLDADQRALLGLHDIEGYTLKEMIAMTGLKEGTLKSRLHRARARLGRLLQSDAGARALRVATGG
jgi:RNA polymerase sigma factor (sigma-70 family)